MQWVWTLTKKLLIGRTKILFADYNVNKQWVLHNHHRDGCRQQVPFMQMSVEPTTLTVYAKSM